MRLDKYLKVSRLIKRRTVANDACDAGRVMVNDKVVKASYDVKVGDIIEIQFGNKNVRARVTDVKDTVKKEEAKEMFDFANRMSPLGNASADECADYCIVMFSDLTRKVTMQNLYHDGGFSSVSMSLRAMATYEKGLDEYKDENGNIIYG